MIVSTVMSTVLFMLWAMSMGTRAYTTFTPQCSRPAGQVNYVSSADSRGSLDILWSCLFTIFACTWTIQHLNVPEQRGDRDPGWVGDLKWALKGTLRKSKWMLITVLAPELMLSIATANLANAVYCTKFIQPYADEDEIPWSLTHSLFANMGGFVLRGSIQQHDITETVTSGIAVQLPVNSLESSTPPVTQQTTRGEPNSRLESTVEVLTRNLSSNELGDQDLALDSLSNPTRDADLNSIRDGHDVEILINHLPPPLIGSIEGKTEDLSDQNPLAASVSLEHNAMPVVAAIRTNEESTNSSEPQVQSYPNPFHLTAHQVWLLRSSGHLAKLPRVTKDELEDKSNSDSFSKAIAVLQISWITLQVIARGVRSLAISQLEIAVIAFSLCAVIIYGIQWLRPKDVYVPITLVQFHGPIPSGLLNLLARENKEQRKHLPMPMRFQRIESGSHIPNDVFWDKGFWFLTLGLVLGAVAFGAPHLGAWNFAFPTQIEQNLWRAASLVSTFMVPLAYIFVIFVSFIDQIRITCFGRSPSMDRTHRTLLERVVAVLSFFHIIGRLFILVEIFRTLLYLPSDAYISTWASNIPHAA